MSMRTIALRVAFLSRVLSLKPSQSFQNTYKKSRSRRGMLTRCIYNEVKLCAVHVPVCRESSRCCVYLLDARVVWGGVDKL